MAWMKRIGLFLAVNFLVVMTLSLLMGLLGVQPYLTAQGIQYEQLMIFCLIWGMGGAFISLGLSRIMAKWMMGVKLIDPQTQDPELQNLVQTVHSLARSAGLGVMPQVGIYDSPEVNAFATGPTKNRALVAVSRGLISRMSHEQVEGVLGHEVAHIANGDMITMTLLQGVVNAFVMFLARVLAFVFMQVLRSRDDREGEGISHFAYIMTVWVLEMVFMIFGSMVIAWFSRYREYRADAGGARLAGRDKMIGALQGLQRVMGIQDPHAEKPAFQSMKISSRKGASFMAFFSTHPPLEERIERLSRATVY